MNPKKPRINPYEFGRGTLVLFRDTENGWKATDAEHAYCDPKALKAYQECKGDLNLLQEMVLREVTSESLGRLPRFVIKPSELKLLVERDPTIRSWYNEGISGALQNKIETAMKTGSSHTKTAPRASTSAALALS